MGAHAFPQRGDCGTVPGLHLPELTRRASQLAVGPADEDLGAPEAAGGLEVVEAGTLYIAVCRRRGHRWVSSADGLDVARRAACEVCAAIGRALDAEKELRRCHPDVAARLGW